MSEPAGPQVWASETVQTVEPCARCAAKSSGIGIVETSIALAVPGAHVHLYGKETRPMRKLGHVTVSGEDARSVRKNAWLAAAELGTPVPLEIEEQIR